MKLSLQQTMELWLELDWIRAVDIQFAKQLIALTPIEDSEQRESCLLALVLLSHQVGRGHVCIELSALFAEPDNYLAIPPVEKRYAPADLASLKMALAFKPQALLEARSSAEMIDLLVQNQLASDGVEVTPLVIANGRLYLRRYWIYEQQVAATIRGRLTVRAELQEADSPLSELLSLNLNRLFAPSTATDYQKAACALAARTQFSLITGGPGSGKTTTVVKLLALLQSMAKADTSRTGAGFKIELAAPTGKAAARLNESIRFAVTKLETQLTECGLALDELPTKVRTLHRLLGSRRFSREFNHNSDNPLPVDVLVIDEASMVDLSMLAAVVAALPPHAKLILIGDKDQLASVEAGSVLGELCARALEGHYSQDTATWLHQVAQVDLPSKLLSDKCQPLDQSIAMLRRSYRFDASSGIGRLAHAINSADSLAETITECIDGSFPDIRFFSLDTNNQGSRTDSLHRLIEQHACIDESKDAEDRVGYTAYLRLIMNADLRSETPQATRNQLAEKILRAYSRFQLLTPVRQGDFGVTEINRRITAQLHRSGMIDSSREWFQGRPIIINANDYNLGLMNGDIGICLMVEGRPLVVFMPTEADEQMRWIPPSRLPAHETVFAMTVHKSQGSEFEHCALVIPPQDSPVLTRELLYTAITRARSHFTLISDRPQSLLKIAQRRTERASGLGEAMFGLRSEENRDREELTGGDADKTLNLDSQLNLF